jgi:hypothetical protein
MTTLAFSLIVFYSCAFVILTSPVYTIDSDQRPDSNLRPLLKSAFTGIVSLHGPIFSNRFPFQILRSMANFLVRVRAYISDVIGRQFEKVRDGHRLENWMPKKGHRSEVQMSVT